MVDNVGKYLELQGQAFFFNGGFNWMIPSHYIKKWLFHQTSIKKLLFRVPGIPYMDPMEIKHDHQDVINMSCPGFLYEPSMCHYYWEGGQPKGCV